MPMFWISRRRSRAAEVIASVQATRGRGRGKSQAWCRAGNAHFVGLVRVSGWPVVKADPVTLVCASCAGGMQPG